MSCPCVDRHIIILSDVLGIVPSVMDPRTNHVERFALNSYWRGLVFLVDDAKVTGVLEAHTVQHSFRCFCASFLS